MNELILTELVRRLYKVIWGGQADPVAMEEAAVLLRAALARRPEALAELGLQKASDARA